MADTMSYSHDNSTQHASWNPAFRPDDDRSSEPLEPATTSTDLLDSKSTESSVPVSSTSQSDHNYLNPPTKGDPAFLSAALSAPDRTQPFFEPNRPEDAAEPNHIQFFTEGSDEPNAVTQKFPWDSEADSGWDNSSSQNPFDRLDIVGRTNSFPPMQSTTAQDFGDQSTNESGNLQAVLKPEVGSSDGLTNGDGIQSNGAFWEDNGMENEEGDFFDELKTQTKPIYLPPEAESRFEEGVPLVEDASEAQPHPEIQPDGALDIVFEGDGDEEDFFKSTDQQKPVTGHPLITRKSTSQVIGSLHADTLDSPVETPAEIPQPPRFVASGNATDASNPVKAVDEEDDLAARWQAELDEDDDLLLEQDLDLQSPEIVEAEIVPQTNGTSSFEPWSQPAAHLAPATHTMQSNPYAPHQPSSVELTQDMLESPLAATPYSTAPAGPEAPVRAESFANQPRDGYRSPYDLPENIARARRPASSRKTVPPPNSTMAPPPPVRSSSIPSLSAQAAPAISSQAKPAPLAMESIPATKSFFEELPPPPPKQRPGSRSGRYTPQASNSLGAVPPPSLPIPEVQPSIPIPSVESSRDSSYQSQLQSPERIGPYANLAVPAAPVGSGTGPRYSPRPPGSSSGVKPAASPRYSPAPPPPPQSSTSPSKSRYASQPAVPTIPFQPRTSSPLAQHEKNAYGAQDAQHRPSTSGSTYQPQPTVIQTVQSQFVGSVPLAVGQEFNQPAEITTQQTYNPPKNPYAPVSSSDQLPRRLSVEHPSLSGSGPTSYQISPPTGDIQFAPPRRSQTQSPSRLTYGPNTSKPAVEPVQRPASVHAPRSPTKAVNPYSVSHSTQSARETPEKVFIPPTDGQELDPLHRWKGAPIFKFGFGGVVNSCFPQHIPRYAAGQMVPMFKASPGEARVRQLKDLLPSDSSIVRYPGPLRTKSKKKDVIAWLSSRIAAMENEGIPNSLQSDPISYKRHDEKILLWKIIRLLVEYDGALEGTDEIQKTLRSIISPSLQASESDTIRAGDTHSGLYQPTSGSTQTDAVDGRLLELIRNDLLIGEREKAVWRAVDDRLWGHAMILSVLDKPLWKQVVQEFIRREVRSAGQNIESLAALYAILSGNLEESIDELVPPAARIGLQMVSKAVGQGPTKNAFDGLERWRETLGLVLNNHSQDDHRALFSLGQLLSSYGRTEAAHICHLFARVSSSGPVFGGIDDSQVPIVLLGTDHRQFPSTFSHDEDAILLTEIYEFATSVLAGNPAAILPYLQSFKLQHAYNLAEKGSRGDAQQYCEAIAAILKSTTRPSPYYHQRLFTEVDELATRLRQAPSDGSSSWISKPSMEKVSGSMWAKFSSFVAGDESDAASNGSGKDADVGPFAKVAGTPPTMSRSPSVSDLYGSYSTAQPVSNTSSRYAPTNHVALSSSPEQYRGRSSLDSQRSPSIGVSYPQRRSSGEPSTSLDSNPYFAGHGSPQSSYPYHSTPPQSSYVPLAPVEEDFPAQTQPPIPVAVQQSALTTGLQASVETFGQPLDEIRNTDAGVPQYGGYEPPTSSSGYEPPSYQPDIAPVPDSVAEKKDEEERKPKKKSPMDDDEDDLAARAAALQKAEKARRNRDADDAVRLAAEADGECKYTLAACDYMANKSEI
jgi:hypothetical protein